jgi:uncharacterized protein (DUF1786 family)
LKILAVDIGTGTQDILLFDSRLNIENGYKMVLPSPTMMVRERIRQAAAEKRSIVLSGVIMGGGPCVWAALDNIKAGLKVFATQEAAKTFDDDLEKVRQMGITLVSEDEARRLPSDAVRIEMKDLDFDLIRRAYTGFGVSLADMEAVAIAVFDHGDAPPGISDRRFRFEYLDRRVREKNSLSAFAYERKDIPAILTRMQAVASSTESLSIPLVVMDTAPAAVLGATFDPRTEGRPRKLIVNLGNGHMLAFRLGPQGIEGIFEHHTPMLEPARLEVLLRKFAEGTLSNQEIFESQGHGALLYSKEPFPLTDPEFNIIVTGPRRNLLLDSQIKPLFAVPFGDMMLSGCYGLLAAAADILPELAGPIRRALKNDTSGTAEPWELD